MSLGKHLQPTENIIKSGFSQKVPSSSFFLFLLPSWMRAGLRSEPWDARDVLSPSSKRHFRKSPALLANGSLPFALLWESRGSSVEGSSINNLVLRAGSSHQAENSPNYPNYPCQHHAGMLCLPHVPGDSRDIVIPTQRPLLSTDSSIPF